MATYVAFLRSLYLIHQNAHWTTKGTNFYGNHLLFERLYKAAADNSDAAAEKAIGIFGNDTIDLGTQAVLINKIIIKYSSLVKPEDPISLIAASLQAEQAFLALSSNVYKAFEEDGTLTLGLDDLIMSIANKSEEAVYLLKQVGANKEFEAAMED